MCKIEYVNIKDVNPNDFVVLLNNEKIRAHLIEHDLFDKNSIEIWIKEKMEMDSEKGCRVRGILSNSTFAGWCGIQFEQGQYEIALVLDRQYWGLGKSVFTDIMLWAKELGHQEINIHFLHTRPEYKFLKKIAKKVYETEHFGFKFTTYQLSIN